MLRAKRHAAEAQQAAALARAAYERVAKSRAAAAEAAGEAALEKAVKEARAQSRQVQDLRETVEENSKKDAVHDALVAAAPYKQAKLRDLAVADAWQKTAEELKGAAQRYGSAQQAGELEGLSESVRRDAVLHAHQQKAMAQSFQERADVAFKRAEEIRKNATWYDEAEVSTARLALAAATPEGLPPPPLPALP